MVLKPIPIFEVKYWWPIISGIFYHCKVRIRLSVDLQKVKYRSVSTVKFVTIIINF